MKHVDSTGLVAPSIDCDALLGVVTGAQTGAQESHLLIQFCCILHSLHRYTCGRSAVGVVQICFSVEECMCIVGGLNVPQLPLHLALRRCSGISHLHDKERQG